MKIVIVGRGEGWENAPKEGIVWGVNDHFIYQYCTMVWEAHDFSWTKEECFKHAMFVYKEMLSQKEIYGKAIFKYELFKRKALIVNEIGIPLMTPNEYKEDNPVQDIVIPTSIKYPVKEIIREVCGGRRYLTCTVAQMIAYTLYMKKCGITAHGINGNEIDHLELHGCLMRQQEEWAYQRSNCEWLLGKAGEHMKVSVVGANSHILKPQYGLAIYGYQKTYPSIAEKFDEDLAEELYDRDDFPILQYLQERKNFRSV